MVNSNGVACLYRIDSLEQFREVKEEWDAIAAPQGSTVFLTHSWLSEWWSVFQGEAELWILIARDSLGLAGGIPLMLRRGSAGLRCLTFVGSGEVTPNHLDLIARPDAREALEETLIEYLCQTSAHWDVLDLDKLPGDTGVVERIKKLFSARGVATRTELSARCPYSDLPESFELYMKQRGDSTRVGLRRKTQHLKKMNPPIEMRIASTPEEVDEALSVLIEQHQTRWNRLGFPGAFANPRIVEFHRRVTQSALRDGYLRLCYMRGEEGIVAVRYNYEVGGCLQDYMSSFDERFSNLSPSMVLEGYTIEHAIQDGAHRFDTLEGEEAYKFRWVGDVRDNVRLRAFSPHLRGQLTRVRIETGATLREMGLRYVPVKVRRPIYQKLMNLKAGHQFRSNGSRAEEEKVSV